MRSTGMVTVAQHNKGEPASNQSFLTGVSLSSLDVFKAGRMLGHPQRGRGSTRRLNPCSCEGLFPPASLHLRRTAAASHDPPKSPLGRPIKDSSSITAKPALFALGLTISVSSPPVAGRREQTPAWGELQGPLMLCRPVQGLPAFQERAFFGARRGPLKLLHGPAALLRNTLRASWV